MLISHLNRNCWQLLPFLLHFYFHFHFISYSNKKNEHSALDYHCKRGKEETEC